MEPEPEPEPEPEQEQEQEQAQEQEQEIYPTESCPGNVLDTCSPCGILR